MLSLLFLPAAWLAAALPADTTQPVSTGRIHSHLLVPARQQFRLGGGQRYGFAVRGQNTGPVPVDLLELPTQGAAVWRARLVPGQRAQLRVAPGSAVLVRNQTGQQAVLEVDVYARPGLVMTYDPTAGAPAK